MTIYDNPRAWRVRIAQTAVWIFGTTIVWLAFFSGGSMSSFGEQVFVWIVGALTACIMAASGIYLRAYVVKMRLDDGLRITTLTFFGNRDLVVAPSEISFGRERHDVWTVRSMVDNYWIPLNVPGELLPLIVDTTAARVDMQAWARAARQTGRDTGARRKGRGASAV